MMMNTTNTYTLNNIMSNACAILTVLGVHMESREAFVSHVRLLKRPRSMSSWYSMSLHVMYHSNQYIWLSTFIHNTCFQPCMLVQWTQLGVDQKALYTRMLEVKRQNRGKWKGLGIDLYFQHEARTLLHTSCSKLDTNFSCYWLQYETGWHAVSSFVIQKLYSIWDFSTLSSCMMTNTYTGS